MVDKNSQLLKNRYNLQLQCVRNTGHVRTRDGFIVNDGATRFRTKRGA